MCFETQSRRRRRERGGSVEFRFALVGIIPLASRSPGHPHQSQPAFQAEESDGRCEAPLQSTSPRKPEGLSVFHPFMTEENHIRNSDPLHADITHDIIRCAIEVHKSIGGPGVLEKVYQRALAYELKNAGHVVELEAPCPIVYKGQDLSDPEHPLRIDILVDKTVIVECKAAKYHPLFAAQCMTYLRLKKLRVGLVVNFGLAKLTDGVERVVNDLV